MTIRNLAAGAAVLALLAVLGALQGNYGVYVLSTWVVFAIAAQAAFVGLGAYTTTLMMANGIHWSVGALASMALSFVVGLALGYPAMRVQHHMLAFVTLAFGTILYLVFRNEEWLTGGVYGLSGIQRPSFFGISLASAPAFYWFLLGVLGITMGPGLQGAAGKSHSRQQPRSRRARHYAAGLCHRLVHRGTGWRPVCAAHPVH
jgi:branched-chain amino acid transport system permease protein